MNLGAGELTATATVAVVAAAVAMPRLEDRQDSVALWAELVPVLTVLVPAGAYSLLARNWAEPISMPRPREYPADSDGLALDIGLVAAADT
ncbi:hypothetical protein [Cryobacterium sp. PH31-O1]|uniref:hypothetical protein n=1 Tax=Cryobacterium sp. PH31-O1 TaxID=3046306 RepID=UPI0024BADA76|nr:hypothetical protein [Cryobacterium sp. PH31-O1]MDJ0337133.1 hypothetical protein [Cryobacterium sp. PH31-O1]